MQCLDMPFPIPIHHKKKYILYRHSIFYRSYPYLLFQALVVLVNLDFDFSLLWLMSLRFFVSCLTSNLSLKIARFAIICFCLYSLLLFSTNITRLKPLFKMFYLSLALTTKTVFHFSHSTTNICRERERVILSLSSFS